MKPQIVEIQKLAQLMKECCDKNEIKKYTDNSVKYVLNTHWHGDHTGGNVNFGSEGAIIIAHDNVKKRVSTDQFMKAFSREVKAQAKEAWIDFLS